MYTDSGARLLACHSARCSDRITQQRLAWLISSIVILLSRSSKHGDEGSGGEERRRRRRRRWWQTANTDRHWTDHWTSWSRGALRYQRFLPHRNCRRSYRRPGVEQGCVIYIRTIWTFVQFTLHQWCVRSVYTEYTKVNKWIITVYNETILIAS